MRRAEQAVFYFSRRGVADLPFKTAGGRVLHGLGGNCGCKACVDRNISFQKRYVAAVVYVGMRQEDSVNFQLSVERVAVQPVPPGPFRELEVPAVDAPQRRQKTQLQ